MIVRHVAVKVTGEGYVGISIQKYRKRKKCRGKITYRQRRKERGLPHGIHHECGASE